MKHPYRVDSYDGFSVVLAPGPLTAKKYCRQYKGQRLRVRRASRAELRAFNKFIKEEYGP